MNRNSSPNKQKANRRERHLAGTSPLQGHKRSRVVRLCGTLTNLSSLVNGYGLSLAATPSNARQAVWVHPGFYIFPQLLPASGIYSDELYGDGSMAGEFIFKRPRTFDNTFPKDYGKWDRVL